MEEKIIFTGNSKTGNDIVLRYTTAGDVEAMHAYINELSGEKTYIRYQGETITLHQEQAYVDHILKLIERHKAVQLLAFCSGTLVGNSEITMDERIHSHVGRLGISVKKEFRRQGIGKLLFTNVLEEAKKHLTELHIIRLGVFANNDLAKNMYEWFGFKEYGRLPKGVKHKGEFIDHIEMYKTIRTV